jgi:hypothetical protein
MPLNSPTEHIPGFKYRVTTGLELSHNPSKNNVPNKGGAFRAINAPPQTLNVHKFPFIEVPPK